MLGDFNIIENPVDQQRGQARVVARDEKEAWRHLKRRMKAEDSFCHKDGHLKYLWDSRRMHKHDPVIQAGPLGNRVLSRINRVYTPIYSSNQLFRHFFSTILPGFALSDRALALLSVIHSSSTPPFTCRAIQNEC